MPKTIAAQITLSDADMARLQPGSGNDELLREVRDVLAEVQKRLADSGEILIDAREAARRLSICARTLQNASVPFVKLGTRRLYRVESLRDFAKQMEHADALTG